MAPSEQFQRTRHPGVREFINVGPGPEAVSSGAGKESRSL
jgi:hypothetical protein